MKEIILKGLDEKIYYDECENGLKIYIWKKENVNTFKGTLVFPCGAEQVSFKVHNQKKSVPFGTAHYLEHILCKNEDGSSLLGQFNALNSYSNAATYPDRTAYEFVGTDDIYANLNLLLDSIQEKKFSKEAFESERGPILEEERMRRDDANRLSFYNINSCLFHTYPNRVSGLGTEEDIKSITLEDLETFYNTFYHPKNSFLIVTGNIDPLKVFNFIKEKEKTKKFPLWEKPTFPRFNEPKTVVKNYEEIHANVEVPKVYVSLKVPIDALPKKNILFLQIVLQLVLESNFGSTSTLKEELLTKKRISTLGTSVDWERKFFVLKVVAKTKYPEKVIPILQERMKKLLVQEEDIFRKIKSEIANLVLGFEDIETVNDWLGYTLTTYGKIITNEKQILESITIQDVQNIMEKVETEQMNTFVMLPLKKGDEN